ncbi:uncharacterized protein C8Q71DRAFT_855004 [Rhodofomes roseus]|uniref:Uncharacterized protein n=1 Tax=Rhodofomes roseus TaxID=34475 RepID=A0ABQ8KRA1_9APHY|nr:uncharacterized protein C8Q71DRAFT_855004 [Rhodofomes roseus]KAH9841159.1 hypothetical protein C8Q71DRAFT_855004 [Rhodofomes roseus]
MKSQQTPDPTQNKTLTPKRKHRKRRDPDTWIPPKPTLPSFSPLYNGQNELIIEVIILPYPAAYGITDTRRTWTADVEPPAPLKKGSLITLITDSGSSGTGLLSAICELRRHWVTFSISGATPPCNLRVPVPWTRLDGLEGFTHQNHYQSLSDFPPPHHALRHAHPKVGPHEYPYARNANEDEIDEFKNRLARITNSHLANPEPKTKHTTRIPPPAEAKTVPKPAPQRRRKEATIHPANGSNAQHTDPITAHDATKRDAELARSAPSLNPPTENEVDEEEHQSPPPQQKGQPDTRNPNENYEVIAPGATRRQTNEVPTPLLAREANLHQGSMLGPEGGVTQTRAPHPLNQRTSPGLPSNPPRSKLRRLLPADTQPQVALVPTSHPQMSANSTNPAQPPAQTPGLTRQPSISNQNSQTRVPNNPWNSGRRSPGQPGSPSFAAVAANKDSTRMRDIRNALAPSNAQTNVATPTPTMPDPTNVASALASNQTTTAKVLDTQPGAAAETVRTPTPANTQPEQPKKKKAKKTVIAAVGLGLPIIPADPVRLATPHDAQARPTDGKRKRQRIEDYSDDSDEASRPQPVTRVQNQPRQLPDTTESPKNDLLLTPGYNSDREPTVGDIDAYNGFDPSNINPAHRPPPFPQRPDQWTPGNDPSWAPPSIQEDIFWSGGHANHAAGPPNQAPATQGDFEDTEMDEMIRNFGFPNPTGPPPRQPPRVSQTYERQHRPHPPSHPPSYGPNAPRGTDPPTYAQGNPLPPALWNPPQPSQWNIFPPAQWNAPPVAPTYQTQPRDTPAPPQSLGRAPTPRLQAAPQPPYNPPGDAPGEPQFDVPTPRWRPAQSTRPPVTPPRRPPAPRLNPTGETAAQSRPQSRAASIISYASHADAAQRNARREDDDMAVDEEAWQIQGDYPLPQEAPQNPYVFGEARQPTQYNEQYPFNPLTQTFPPSNGPADPGPSRASFFAQAFKPTTVTPRPEGDWREIQGSSFYSKHDGQCRDQASRWQGSDRPGVLFFFAAHGARDGDADQWHRMNLLENSLKQTFHIPAPEIYIPDTINGAVAKHNDNPFCMLLQGITDAQKKTLIAEKWHVKKGLAVRFLDPTLAPSTWMGAWEKNQAFGTMKTEQILPFFQAAFRRDPLRARTFETIERDKKLGPLSKWGATPPEVAFAHIVRSVRIRSMPRQTAGGAINPLIQLYCESPTAHPQDWHIWRETVRQQPYSTDNGAKAVLITEEFLCKLCHSIDHPLGLCDLPSVPGWLGPSREEVQAAANADHRRGPPPNNATRGHGGARGGHRGGHHGGSFGGHNGGNYGSNRGGNRGGYGARGQTRSRTDTTTHADLLQEANVDWWHSR